MTPFHFLRPAWLLALVPAAAILWAAVRFGERAGGWRGLVDAHLLRVLVVDGGGAVRRWPLALAGIGWLVATLAMAGPTWERVPQPTYEGLAPTVVVLDMSPSMQADDVKPSRLGRARFELHDVLAHMDGGQVGLVLYSDEPYVAAPLTDDPRVIEEMIPTLTPDLMPAPGGRADRAIAMATGLLQQAHAAGGRILLLSDGIDERPDATLAAARDAAAAGQTVSVLALGTDAGAPLRDLRGRLVRDGGGQPVTTRLDAAGLEAVADAGDGRFRVVGAGPTDIAGLLGDTALPSGGMLREGGATAQADVWRDAGVWLVLALVVLAPFGFRRGWLAVALLALTLGSADAAQASLWSDLWARPDQQGAAALAQGRPEAAAQLFDDSSWKAAAQYQSGSYDQAAEGYRALDDPESRYNLGNALARSGKLEDAVAAYDQVLAKNPDHEDARFNRDLVQRLLDQQKQQQQGGDSAEQQSGGRSGDQQQAKGDSQSDSGRQGESGQQSADAGDQQGAQQGDQQDEAGGQQQAEQSAGDDHQQAGADQQSQQAKAGDSEQQQADAAQANAGDEQPGQDDSATASAADAQQPDAEEPHHQQTADARDTGVEPTAPPTRSGSGDGTPMTEEQQAREQMLRRIPDDPGGLLRAKILRRYAEQRYASQGGTVR